MSPQRAALLRYQGCIAEADAMMATLNRINDAFDRPHVVEPVIDFREGLIVADAREMSPAAFLAAVKGTRANVVE